ncbi:hypothetical protein AcW1_010093 [Taiwanofungus camphoratus]|nr:hypothetical protein AcW1_010093 [Antrodia cinnamomea]
MIVGLHNSNTRVLIDSSLPLRYGDSLIQLVETPSKEPKTLVPGSLRGSRVSVSFLRTFTASALSGLKRVPWPADDPCQEVAPTPLEPYKLPLGCNSVIVFGKPSPPAFPQAVLTTLTCATMMWDFSGGANAPQGPPQHHHQARRRSPAPV